MAISPLAPDHFPELPPIGGVRLSTHAAGMKYQNRADLMLATVPEATAVAGVFTQSRCPSAPVDWCRRIVGTGGGRAVVCNSGSANAFTGVAGETAAELTAETIAEALGVSPDEIYLASTGVIGENLPTDTLSRELPRLTSQLADSTPDGWEAAANAIRTTDTFAKGASAAIDGTTGMVVGIAKGSGMIAPDMATMLSFVFTDLAVAPAVLAQQLAGSVESSFNRITVDSETSTSDTVLLFATGANDQAPILDDSDSRIVAFRAALDSVTLSLAHQIVRDGEGATKFVEVAVSGAADDHAAKVIALSVANSPLVKTALAAEDANWGRIVMAVGKAGQAANRDELKIWIGPELTAEHGVQAPEYSEARATEHLRQAEVRLGVDVGVGEGSASVWTCDLTHGYIEINAGYRS